MLTLVTILTGAGPEQDSVHGVAGPEAQALLVEAKMRCGGCGAKVRLKLLFCGISRSRHP